MARPERIDSALQDASALIGLIKGESEFAILRSLLAAIDRGQVRLVESTAILAEVLSAHARDSHAQDQVRRDLRSLLEAPTTELVDVSTVVARRAGELRVARGMSTWDAIHLATAIVARVDVLVVRDGKFPQGDYDGVWLTGPFDLDDDKLPGT